MIATQPQRGFAPSPILPPASYPRPANCHALQTAPNRNDGQRPAGGGGPVRAHPGDGTVPRRRAAAVRAGQRGAAGPAKALLWSCWRRRHPRRAPIPPGLRFLRRRGEAPYLIIFETREYDRLRRRLRQAGVRITGETEHHGSRSAFLHPSSCNGAFLEIVEVLDPDNPWPAAGPDWASLTRPPGVRPSGVVRLRQVAIIVRDLDAALAHWSPAVRAGSHQAVSDQLHRPGNSRAAPGRAGYFH